MISRSILRSGDLSKFPARCYFPSDLTSDALSPRAAHPIIRPIIRSFDHSIDHQNRDITRSITRSPDHQITSSSNPTIS
jgi:hypothetical protein